MNLVVSANKRTGIQKVPGDNSVILYYIDKDIQLKITGITRVGIHSVYTVHGGGYVEVSDVRVLRDMDYYFSNKAAKNGTMLKNNLSTVGAHGLGEIIGNAESLTPNWFDLHRHGLLDNIASSVGVVPSVNAQIPTTVGGGFGGGFTGAIGAKNGPLIPTGRTTVPTAEAKKYSTNIENMKISSAFTGLDSNVTSLLGDIKFGSLTDGTFLNNLLGNALGLLGNWARAKLNFVVGFDITAVLSALFQAFGTSWDGLIKLGMNSLFGINGSSILNTIVSSGALSTYQNSNSVSSLKSGYGVNFFEVKAGEGDRFTFKYAEVTQAMKDYFKYKGCDGRMITKSYAGLTWTQDETYATPILESKKDEKEIAIWKNLYNADYSELNQPIDKIKEEFNLNIDRKTLFVSFNRYRVPVPDHELCATRGYIFFTRPDLNLTMGVSLAENEATNMGAGGDRENNEAPAIEQGRINEELNSYGNAAMRVSRRTVAYARAFPLMNNIMKSHSVLASYLMGDKAGVSHQFIPILSHACTGIEVADEVLETTETGETYTGWKYLYGTSLIKSKTAGTVSVTFRDDDMLSIYKIMKVWCEYINAVYRGEAEPNSKYLRYHQIDYAIAIYYFLCKATADNEILFWTKYTGCFPTAIPSSNFSDSLGNPIKQPSYTIPFAYARKDDYNPIHIIGFNQLSDTNFQYMPTYNKETLHVNKSFVGAPFVDTNNGSMLFKLKFRPN